MSKFYRTAIKKFEIVQSLQLVIGFVFGYFLDLNM